MLALIVQNRNRVNWRLVRSCRVRSLAQRQPPRLNFHALAYSAILVVAALGLIYIGAPGWFSSTLLRVSDSHSTSMPQKAKQPRLMAAPISEPERAMPIKQTPAGVAIAVPLQPSDEAIATTTQNGPAPSPKQAVSSTGAPAGSESVDRTTPPILPAQQAKIAKPVQPSLLGVLTVKRNDTLGLMVKTIYGDFREHTLKTVLDANPHIGDANAIRVGDSIAFPAIPTVFVPRAYPLWWLKAGEAGLLETAFRRSIKASDHKDAPLMRIITEWDPKTGLTYGIYVAGYFFNPSAAENMLARLPAEFTSTAKLISGWADQTVLFSDPFSGRGY
jgi:hypothetical protein